MDARPTETTTLLAAAQAGDGDAFGVLITPHLKLLRSLAYRLLANRADSEDAVQETLVRALAEIDGFRGEASLKTWLFRIATNICLDMLRHRGRWGPDAQVNGQRVGSTSPEHLASLEALEGDSHYRYEVAEHVAFCFSCVSRSLPPEQQAAVLLREVFELSNREAAKVLDITESVLRHHLSAGRGAMQATFEGMCALIGKTGVCQQCKGFRDRAAPERRDADIDAIGPATAEAGENFARRAAIVREADLEGGTAQALHDQLFRELAEWEAARTTRRPPQPRRED